MTFEEASKLPPWLMQLLFFIEIVVSAKNQLVERSHEWKQREERIVKKEQRGSSES